MRWKTLRERIGHLWGENLSLLLVLKKLPHCERSCAYSHVTGTCGWSLWAQKQPLANSKQEKRDLMPATKRWILPKMWGTLQVDSSQVQPLNETTAPVNTWVSTWRVAETENLVMLCPNFCLSETVKVKKSILV